MNRIHLCFGLVILHGWCAQVKAQQVPVVSELTQEKANPDIDQVLGLKKISELQVNIRFSKARKPEDRFAGVQAGAFVQREYRPVILGWETPDLCYHPLFFEDIGLERYGQDAGLLQPVLSGAHFFGRVATLPLHAMTRRPRSLDFPLGHYRPGNCNPYLHYSWPW